MGSSEMLSLKTSWIDQCIRCQRIIARSAILLWSCLSSVYRSCDSRMSHIWSLTSSTSIPSLSRLPKNRKRISMKTSNVYSNLLILITFRRKLTKKYFVVYEKTQSHLPHHNREILFHRITPLRLTNLTLVAAAEVMKYSRFSQSQFISSSDHIRSSFGLSNRINVR